MKKVFITRKIPDIGLKMLSDKGYEVDSNPLGRPLKKEELIEFLKVKPYDAVLSLLNDRIDGEVFDVAPTVKIYANFAAGFDNFAVEEGKKRGIYLTNVPGGGASRVAEHVFALILALTCRVVEGHEYVKAGKYTGWDPMLLQGLKIAGKTLGLIGAGRIGSEVIHIASRGFGMRVVYNDVLRNEHIEQEFGALFLPTITDVLKQADIVTLHVPLLDSTKHIINAESLKMMKPTAYLVNTSRGPVIDEEALVQALKAGLLAGVGLDVFEREPLVNPALLTMANVVLTPHIASSTADAREEMVKIAVNNIVTVLEGGKPKDMVYN